MSFDEDNDNSKKYSYEKKDSKFALKKLPTGSKVGEKLALSAI